MPLRFSSASKAASAAGVSERTFLMRFGAVPPSAAAADAEAPSPLVSAAAAALGVSPSQLVRLLEKEPAALGALNRLRGAAGLKPLR